MSWWKKVEKPFWAILPAKNRNCHKSINIAKRTLIFGPSTKWISRVIWPFIKIFCLLFKILRFEQNSVKTSGSPQTWLGKKFCPKSSWILFSMLKWSCTAISVMGFWIWGEKLNFEDFCRLPEAKLKFWPIWANNWSFWMALRILKKSLIGCLPSCDKNRKLKRWISHSFGSHFQLILRQPAKIFKIQFLSSNPKPRHRNGCATSF